MVDLSRGGQKAGAYQLYETKGLIPRRAASKALEKLIALNNDGAREARAQSTAVYEETRTISFIAIGLAPCLSMFSGVVIVLGVTRGIASVVRPMEALIAGDLSAEIPRQAAKTEIGAIAAAVQVFKDGLIQMKALEAESAEARVAAEEQRQAGMRQMADSFETAVGGIVGQVSASATELQATAGSMSALAGQTSAQSGAVAAAEVASEVKALAKQTAKATDEISDQIGRVQGVTGQAVGAIGAITARIREINGVAASIAAAVAEQGAATQEIVRNVGQAAAGTGEVTSNIAGVAGAAEETGRAASQVLGAASALSRQSEHLTAEVARFLDSARRLRPRPCLRTGRQ